MLLDYDGESAPWEVCIYEFMTIVIVIVSFRPRIYLGRAALLKTMTLMADTMLTTFQLPSVVFETRQTMMLC